MKLKDQYQTSQGRIALAKMCKRTGNVIGHYSAFKNVVTYNAADILAQLLAGNQNYVPRHIGFIYAPAAATPADPGSDREQSWETITSDVKAINGNIVVSRLGANPLLAADGPDGRYDNNAVTLNAVSDATADLTFSGTGYATVGPQAGSDKYFHVVLLAEVYGPGQTVPTYIPYARAALGAGIDVAADTELAVYWTQTFK